MTLRSFSRRLNINNVAYSTSDGYFNTIKIEQTPYMNLIKRHPIIIITLLPAATEFWVYMPHLLKNISTWWALLELELVENIFILRLPCVITE